MPVFGRWFRGYTAHFIAVGSTFYTTVRVNAARFSPVGVGVMLPFHCCWCRLLHYGEGKCRPFLGRWCRRYAAHFAAVSAAFYTTARVNAARFSAVGVGAMVTIVLLLVANFHNGEGKCRPFFGRGVGAMPPISLLLVPHFTLRRG